MTEVVPKSGEYLRGKLWFDRRGTMVTLGLTSSAIDELGDIEGIEFPEEDDEFAQGDVIATVEGNLGSLEILAPAAGVIRGVNATVQSEPERVAEDPLEEGWLIKIEIEDPTELTDIPE